MYNTKKQLKTQDSSGKSKPLKINNVDWNELHNVPGYYMKIN